ncbi:MAG: hypothetical protein CK424_06780 [Legionella sp.]|nr:MAG: hypothetical protein CK424_06780 [Legionella sp.]
MANDRFYLNYGGPGGWWLKSDENAIKQLDNICKQHYGPPNRTKTWVTRGLTVTVHTYGIHRGLQIEIPDNADDDTRQLYYDLRKKAKEFCAKDYFILGNNCVTSVAAILHALDPTIINKYYVFPWTFDAAIQHYLYPTVVKPFLDVYEKKIHNESSTRSDSFRMKLKEIKSSKDIIKTAHSQNDRQRERTKSALLELHWVIQDNHGVLHPTPKAPVDFSLGLNKYNHEVKKTTQLKWLYEKENLDAHVIFKDAPNYITAIERIKNQIPRELFSKITNAMADWEKQDSIDNQSISDEEIYTDLESNLSDDLGNTDVIYTDEDDIFGDDDMGSKNHGM